MSNQVIKSLIERIKVQEKYQITQKTFHWCLLELEKETKKIFLQAGMSGDQADTYSAFIRDTIKIAFVNWDVVGEE